MAKLAAFAAVSVITPLQAVHAQNPNPADPVLERIWELGMEGSRVARLAQVLMDSVGPRLTGSPGQLAAHEWAVKTYESWGVSAENEEYGTWTAWTYNLLSKIPSRTSSRRELRLPTPTRGQATP